jgi:CcmD family protein
LTYLYVAYTVAGVLIGGYVLYLVRDLRRVKSDLDEVKRGRSRSE